MILRSRVVLPLDGPPIENGAVQITGDRIARVGSWTALRRESSQDVVDLGDRVLLPGLVNAHCHLDYTSMGGQLTPSGSFTSWINSITAIKGSWTDDDFSRSWQRGARMLIQQGCTTVADIEAVPALLPDMWNSTPLRVLSFLEMTGVKSRQHPERILGEALSKIDSLDHPRSRASLSPHAPYSTTPQLLRLSAKAARQRGWPVTTHVAESREEYEMFMYRKGHLFRWLERNSRDMSDCGHGSPVTHLLAQGVLGPDFIAVHVNYLWDHDAELLGAHQVSVVHCPRSHDFFEHQRFPYEPLKKAGVNICLGTDSLATVKVPRGTAPALDLFAEMRAFMGKAPAIAPEAVLDMCTVNAARALGLAGKSGSLSVGAFADLIALPFRGSPAAACSAVVHHEGPVAAAMVNGEWAVQPQLG